MTTRIAETIRQFQTGQNHEKNKQTVKSSNMPQKLSERAWLVVNRYGDGESFAKSSILHYRLYVLKMWNVRSEVMRLHWLCSEKPIRMNK